MRRVWLCDLDHRNGVFLRGIVGGHIEIDRLAVQRVAVGGGNLHQRIARAIFQLFGRNKVAVAIRVKGVDGGDFGIGEGLRNERPVRAVEPEACTSQRNDLSRFGIHLDDFDIALKIAVVGKVAIGLPILGDIHIEIGKQLTPVPALGLMHRVDTVGQAFCYRIAVFIAGQVVTLGCLCTFIRAIGFQENRKLCAGLRRFKLGFAIVRVLDDGDFALDDLLGHIVCGGVIFHGVVFRLCADGINSAVQQIALGGHDLTNGPVVAADIVFRGELPVGIRGVGVYKLVALIDAVDSTGKGSIALRQTRFGVALGDGDIPLFQNVRKAIVRDGVPFHCRRLLFGDDIADRRIDFFQRVARADQYIGEYGFACAVGHGVFIHRKPRKRSAIKVELHAFIQSVLGGLGHDEGSALQGVIEIDRCHLTADDGDTAHFLRLVFVVALLGDGVNAGGKVVDLNDAARARHNGLVHTVAGDRKGNALYLAVLTGLDDLGAAVGHFQVKIGFDRIADCGAVSDHILHRAIRAVMPVAPYHDTLTGIVFGSRNRHRFRRSCFGSDGQRIAAGYKGDPRLLGGKGVVTQHTVGVGQCNCITAAIPAQFDHLCLVGAPGHEAGNDGMLLHAGLYAVIIGRKAAVQRVTCPINRFHGICTAGVNMIKIGIPFSDYRFPYQHLRRHHEGQLVGIRIILRTPAKGQISLIAVLHDPPQQGLDGIGVDSAVALRGIVLPVIFAIAGVGSFQQARYARLNAVTGRAVKVPDGVQCRHPSLFTGCPAVHIVEFVVSPCAAGVQIGIPISGKRHRVGLGGFPGGRCGKGSHAAAQNGCEADQQGQQPRNAPSIEFFHLLTSLLT